MKTFYRRQARISEKSFSGNDFLAVILVLAVFAVGLRNELIIKRPFINVKIAAQSLVDTISDGTLYLVSGFFSNVELKRENEALKRELHDTVLSSDTNTKRLLSEIGELKEELGRGEYEHTAKTAFIIGKPPASPYGTVVIDIGAKDGVKEGSLALFGGYIVGFVSAVHEVSSIVSIYGQKGETQNLLVGAERIPLAGRGIGFGVFIAEYVNSVQAIKGKEVRLSLHPEYYFGRVVVENMENKYEVAVQSPVNIFELAALSIVTNED